VTVTDDLKLELIKLIMAKFLLCRNCGKAGVHAWCKEVFSAEQRVENDNKVRIQLEEHELLKKEKKSLYFFIIYIIN
jgi:hypothetical protein